MEIQRIDDKAILCDGAVFVQPYLIEGFDLELAQRYNVDFAIYEKRSYVNVEQYSNVMKWVLFCAELELRMRKEYAKKYQPFKYYLYVILHFWGLSWLLKKR